MNKIIFELEEDQENSSFAYQMFAMFVIFFALVAVFFIPAVP